MKVTTLHDAGRLFGLVIVGGGPAGLAPLLAAHGTGDLEALLAEGVAVVERSSTLGAGLIGGYAINSDSSGRTFVDCLQGNANELTRLADNPLVQHLHALGDGPASLRDAGGFLHLVGDAIGRMMRRRPSCAVLTNHVAVAAQQSAGVWRVQVRDIGSDEERTLLARHVVLATGAHQPPERLALEKVAGVSLVQRCAGRLLQSGEVLIAGGFERVATLLASRDNPRVAVVGGSTSAAAVARALLHGTPRIPFKAASVTLLHRRELRIYYPDVQTALAEGYTDWTEHDICPISGRLYRFAGFRLESRELVMQALGVGGRSPEPRLQLHRLRPVDPEALRIIDEADLVVAAIGYRPHGLPLRDVDGLPIDLLANTGPQTPLVDGECRIVDKHGVPIPGLFGIGLAAGFVPRGALGGEPSFRGQANGLWLWQHDVGSLIVDGILRSDSGSSIKSSLRAGIQPQLIAHEVNPVVVSERA